MSWLLRCEQRDSTAYKRRAEGIESTQTMKSAVRISSLLWADILVLFALFEMQDYLTEIWGLSFTHAAGILNIWNGISLILQPLFLFAVGTFLGNFQMLLISSSAYTVGIWLLFMSAPPVLANATGTCKQYEQECIGQTQKALLYTGMALIAVGVAGNNVSVKSFLGEQPDRPSQSQRGCWKIFGMIVVVLVGVAGAIALPYIKPWTYRFGIPAVCTTIACISFLTGFCCIDSIAYQLDGPKSDRIANLCGMFSPRMFLMWLTFLVCGIVSSTGNTYFVEQAKHLDRHLGKWNVPTQVLLLAQTYLGLLLAYVVGCGSTRPSYGIFMAKTLGVVCCVAAALTERKRLGVVRSNGLMDKPEEDVPMSVYWLLFQFALLGAVEKLLKNSVDEFREDKMTDEEKKADEEKKKRDELESKCLEIFSQGVSGVGYMCGVLCVFVVGKISAKGDRPNWFQFDLNRSHLDRYYWVLTVLSGASLALLVLGRICCCCCCCMCGRR